jgi:hypothetical protein
MKRAYLVPDGHASAVPAWVTNPHQAAFRTTIGNWHDGAVCASREAAVKLGTILKWAALAFVLWWVIQEPTAAAHLVHNIGSLLSQAAHGLSSFVANI